MVASNSRGEVLGHATWEGHLRVLVIGRNGQLAMSLVERARGHDHIKIATLGRPDVDLETPGSATAAIKALSPNWVINAAAYTAVDKAEDEPERAFQVNAEGAGEIAAAARQIGAQVIQISTDYVFDGGSSEPYREDAPTNPLGVYGRSKLAGEERVRSANPDHLILRTAWVYSPFGRNFVKTMLKSAKDRDEVSVVADQIGCPTSALDLADALLAIVSDCRDDGDQNICGTYHLTGRGECSWADFAEEIYRISALRGGPSAGVRRIATADFPTVARRPRNSVLDSSKFGRRFGFNLPPRHQSLILAVERLVEPIHD